jgi:transposase
MKPPKRPLNIAEDAWLEAVRREAVVRPLALADSPSGSSVQAAADALGLSRAQIYRLIARFRRHPVTISLVASKRGPHTGARRLPDVVEQLLRTRSTGFFGNPNARQWRSCAATSARIVRWQA